MDAPIVKLPASTIKIIAAGEVITRPVNVVKELLENSIDAGSQNIRVIIDQGGMRLIEVIDNGHGIARSNAHILCNRYTTSKLTSADDLNKIATFGFRGEALSSISEVADLEITSFNIKADSMGWSAQFRHGQPTTGIVDKFVQFPGTQIKVTNLFSDAMPRKNSLISSFIDEKRSIVDLVTRFTIHHRERITMILSDRVAGELICSIHPISIGPCIGSFYGMDMESNLFDFKIEHHHPYEAEIYVAFSYKKSNANTHQSNMILFVNDRLVDCDDLRREICALVLEFLSIKQFVSLIYLSLRIPPHDIDVNTHPAKSSVTMHYQQEITALILNELRAKFQDKLATQTVPSKVTSQKTIGELMRHPSTSPAVPIPQINVPPASQQRLRVLAPGANTQSQSTFTQPSKRPYEQVHTDHAQPDLPQMYSRIPPSRLRRDLRLHSLRELRLKVAAEKSEENTKLVRNSVFVGIFDHDHALIQIDTRLYAINFKAFFKELCYQLYLFDFGNFPPIEILPPGNQIQFLIETYIEDIKKHRAHSYEKLTYNTPEKVIDKMLDNSKMLKDYLTLEFTRQEIITIPNVLCEHVPNLINLGKFFVDMANKVDYTDERACFHMMGRLIADFYSEPPANLKDIKVHRKYHEFVKTTIYDAIKRLLLAPEWLFTKENMCQITDTKDLYKVFERC